MKSEQFKIVGPIIFALIMAVSTGCAGVVATSTSSARAAELDEKFKSCVRKEAPIAVNEDLKKLGKNLVIYGYHVNEFNYVISKCTGVSVNYSVTFMAALELEDKYKFDKRFVFAYQVIDDEVKKKRNEFLEEEAKENNKKQEEHGRIEAENERLFNLSSVAYAKCLFKNVDSLAKTSVESADVLSIAIFASCPVEEDNLEKSYMKRYPYFDGAEHFMQTFNKKLQPDLIFRIVAIRAASSVPAEPVAEEPSNNRDQL